MSPSLCIIISASLLINIKSVSCKDFVLDMVKGALRKTLENRHVQQLRLEENSGDEAMNLTMWIYSAENPTIPTILGLSSNLSTVFNKQTSLLWLTETKIIIHGSPSSPEEEWLQTMKDSLIKVYGFNVALLDWRQGALRRIMTITEANTVAVAKATAEFLRALLNQTVADAKMLHIIGHSIGAHLAGIIGRQLGGTIGRITGLDPSQIVSTKEEELHLRSTDADFVDVVYTDMSLLGSEKIVGDVNFLPNGGWLMPGCVKSKYLAGPLQELAKLDIMKYKAGKCSHMISHDYFTASFGLPPVHLMATSCDSYESYKSGNCTGCDYNNSSCAVFGMLTQNPRKTSNVPLRYYLDTADEPPFFHVKR